MSNSHKLAHLEGKPNTTYMAYLIVVFITKEVMF